MATCNGYVAEAFWNSTSSWSSTALVYPPNGQGEHSFTVDGVQIFGESAVVEFNQLSQERLIELVSSESCKGSGAYDLAGAASQDTRLVEGEEVTVLALHHLLFLN